jgi:hypothetical protein
MNADLLSSILNAFGVAEALVSQGIFAYAAFFAFSVRRTFSSALYRRQATGIGFVSLAWILVFIDYVVIEGIFNLYATFFFVNSLLSLLLFYWIDAAVLAARRSDPLARDTLHWQKTRIVLWFAIIAATIGMTALATYYQVITGAEPQFMNDFALDIGVGFIPAGIATVTGLIVLPLAAYRTRDKFLRHSIAWLGAFVAILIVGNWLNALGGIGTFSYLIIAGYCLYKGARSLVPHSIAREREAILE